MDRPMQGELACLREQVAAARDIAEESSRAYQQLWEQQEALGRLEATAGSEEAEQELESIRRREMLYLGQAAALQWVLARIDQMIAVAEQQQLAISFRELSGKLPSELPEELPGELPEEVPEQAPARC